MFGAVQSLIRIEWPVRSEHNMLVDQERTVSITTYYTEPLTHPNVIHVSAHASLDETHEAICSVLQPRAAQSGLTGEPPIPDLLSIIIAFGEIPSRLLSLTNQFAAYEANPPPLEQIPSENIVAIVPMTAQEVTEW